ncbi:MAG: hypothetical protein GX221_07495 [Candidatus Riflebacteria bacterium]|nr:hypothetical protein [Candidatus Riflebacteria bacterium]
MKKTISLLALFLLFTLSASSGVGFASSGAKVAKIDLTLIFALHPKMASFNFWAMGFHKYPLGLSSDERKAYDEKLRREYNPAAEEKTLRLAQEKRTKAYERMSEIRDKENTMYLAEMSKEGAKAYNEASDLLGVAVAMRDEAEYIMRFPYLTTPAETRKTLQEIEKEVFDIIKEVAEKGLYDVVLNQSVPVDFAYPDSYAFGAKYANGPTQVDQSLYYAFMSVREDEVSQNDKKREIGDWLKNTNAPDFQNALPLRPWPLVLDGGDDILLQVVAELYDRYKIDNRVKKILLDYLKESLKVEDIF